MKIGGEGMNEKIFKLSASNSVAIIILGLYGFLLQFQVLSLRNDLVDARKQHRDNVVEVERQIKSLADSSTKNSNAIISNSNAIIDNSNAVTGLASAIIHAR